MRHVRHQRLHMKILITGSSGEIGTNLALTLQARGNEVFGVDMRANTWTDKIPTLLQDLSPQFKNYKNGIGAAQYPHPDVVVHLAANAKVHELVVDPHRALDNIKILFNVLEYCRHNNLPIIFASSREVYGDIHHMLPEKTTVREGIADFVLTESPYSASKIAGEALVHSYSRCYGIPHLIFRFSNVYGRFDSDIERMERVIPLFIKRILNDEPITIYGKNKTLDFTHVDDTVQGLVKGIDALTSRRVTNYTFNLACGKGYTLEEMAGFIASALGKKIAPTFEDVRPGEISYYVADISAVQEKLGFAPTTTLEEGIKKAIAWQFEFNQKKRPQ